MKLEDAEKLAAEIIGVIEPYTIKVAVAGSLRRRRPEPNDIDIVLIPKPFMWESLLSKVAISCRNPTPEGSSGLSLGGSLVIRKGPKIATLKFPGSTVDFYVATPETWGILLLIRTGSKQHNIKLCSKAREMGLMLSACRGVIRDGKVIASKTEQEIFAALGLSYVEPGDRD